MPHPTIALLLLSALLPASLPAQDPWVVYPGSGGVGAGRKVVLVAGDEEYRSEEALPALGRILAIRHGFHCTVLLPIDPQTGIVQPNVRTNIPGLQALAEADVMVIATRFRDLPDAQMAHIDAFLRRGGAVLGLRTATHAFQVGRDQPWARYGNGYNGPEREWHGGFGRLVLGEMWISHHGAHGRESTRGVLAPDAKGHPILRGLADGDVWGPTDVYGVRLPLPGDSAPLLLGQVLAGMTPDAAPVAGEKNEPMLPVAWTRTYQLPGGSAGRAVTTTMGASQDLQSAGTRRFLVQAVCWLCGLGEAIPAEGLDAGLVGGFAPSRFAFHKDEHWVAKALRPEHLAMAVQDPDVATVEGLVAALYGSISGPKGQARDFTRMRKLFAPDARLIPVGAPSGRGAVLPALTVDQYIERSGEFLVSVGFTEREVARSIDRFGGIAQVWSTYEGRRDGDAEPFLRGINSIQCAFDGRRWWVTSLAWQQAGPDLPLPAGQDR